METTQDFEEKYQSFIEGCAWRGDVLPTREEYARYMSVKKYTKDCGMYQSYNKDEVDQICMVQDIIWKGAHCEN